MQGVPSCIFCHKFVHLREERGAPWLSCENGGSGGQKQEDGGRGPGPEVFRADLGCGGGDGTGLQT